MSDRDWMIERNEDGAGESELRQELDHAIAAVRELRAALLERNLEMQELANRAEELVLCGTERDKREVMRLVELWRQSRPAELLTRTAWVEEPHE